jgi:hypothetical protein
MSDSFWEGGAEAWDEGLQTALQAATEQLAAAATEAERHAAQSRLDELRRQEADAEETGERRLF